MSIPLKRTGVPKLNSNRRGFDLKYSFYIAKSRYTIAFQGNAHLTSYLRQILNFLRQSFYHQILVCIEMSYTLNIMETAIDRRLSIAKIGQFAAYKQLLTDAGKN